MNGLFALIGGGETVLRAFCSSALWQIYQTQYLLFRMQKCRFTTPQGAGMQVYNSFLLRVQESQCPPWGMGYSLICLRSPDPTLPPSTSTFEIWGSVTSKRDHCLDSSATFLPHTILP
jgi:hypothetical protein